MSTTVTGGTVTSFNNAPQAVDDAYSVGEDLGVTYFDVMSNDLGGKAKVLWSIDDSTTDGSTDDEGSGDGSIDLMSRDVAGVCETSDLGARMWMTSDGRIGYDTSIFNSLGAGETATDSFTYAIRMSNGTLSWATVTVTIIGSNDAPVAVADSAAVDEDSSISGNVGDNDSDPDNDAELSYALVGDAPAGLTFGADGSWSFDASSYDSLADGDELVLTIPYTVTDEHGASDGADLTITITGTNDAPVAAADSAEVDEDSTTSGNVGGNDTDADDGAVLSYALVGDAPAGLTFGADGSWSFDASSYDSLAEGDELVLTIPYTVTDEHGASDGADLTITITGTNDAPVAAADSAEVDEDSTTSGNVGGNDTDADDGAVLSYALVGDAPAGLTFGADGSWSFDASSYDSLAEGDELVLTIPYTVTDEHGASDGADLTITITGTNDAPVAAADSAEVDEDSTTSGNVGGNDTDADDGAVLSYALVGDAPAGLTFGADGSWSFDASSYDSLAEGDELVLTIPYTVTDEHGASDGADLTITITGTNDAPVAAADSAEVDEDSTTSGNVGGNDTDADDGAVLSYALVGDAPAGLTFGADGSWSFDASSYDSLAEGDELVLTIPYTVTDEHGASDGADLTITITGTNDAPVAAAVVLDAIAEDSGPRVITQAELLAASSDADGDSLTVTALSIASGSGGNLVANIDGTWTYTPAADDDTSVTFNFTVSDGSLTDNSTATLDITPVDDPTYTSPAPYTGTGDPNDFDGLVGGAVNNSGTINGDGGNNTITGGGAGQTINGANGNDTIYGGGGDDNINGGNHDDTLYGQAGVDTVDGNNGLDTLYGGSGDDILTGGNDADVIYGGSGADTITGSGGTDTIIGGYGADILTGGGDADTFVYLSNLDTGDTITDFSQAQGDKIDLSAFAPSSFVGELTEAGAVGANQVGFMQVGGTTVIYVDTDGIFGADLEITLDDSVSLVAGDFLFGP